MTDEPGGDVVIPHEFFAEILPGIGDLSELKLVLHVCHLAAARGAPTVPLPELFSPGILRSIVGEGSPEPASERLWRTLDRAFANGVLLRLIVRRPDGSDVYVVPATTENRDVVHRIGHDVEAAERLRLPAEFEAAVYRPNVFAFYERHIGPLTPLVAEQLREAERGYPRAWIEQAILEAVHYNKRTWRYIEKILTNWETSGAPDGISRN